ncbi:MAG: hypothetical protein ABFD62_04965 [Syntrophaceae bacterium]
MQLINKIAGAFGNRYFPEKTAVASMALVLFWIWGPTLFYGHTFALVIGAVLLTFLSLPGVPFKIFGIYLAVWCGWMYSAAFVETIPIEMIIDLSSELLFIVAGSVFFLTVLRGRFPICYYQHWLCIFALVMAGIALSQYHFFKIPSLGTIGNQNFFAAYTAISFPLFFRRGWIWWTPILLYCLIVANTTTAFVAMLAGVGYYFYPQLREIQKKAAALVLALMIGAGLYYGLVYHPSVLTSERWDMWADAVNKISSHWYLMLFGVGPGVTWKVGNALHSEYAYMLFNLGLVGLLLMGAIMKSIPRANREFYAAFVVIAVDAIGNHVFHTAPTALLSIVVIAILFKAKLRKPCGSQPAT